jgi:hypothetical protein
VRLRPDAANRRQTHAAEFPNLALGEQHRGAIAVPQRLQQCEWIVVAEGGVDRQPCREGQEISLAELVGITPIATGEEQVGLELIDRLLCGGEVAMEIADGYEPH